MRKYDGTMQISGIIKWVTSGTGNLEAKKVIVKFENEKARIAGSM